MDFIHERNISVMFLFVIVLVLPIFCYSQAQYVSSRATYYRAFDGLGIPNGACGYGDYGRFINGGDVALVSSFSKLYKSGAGCGACYQIRCKTTECTSKGVVVVVTDHGGDPDASFILSSHAFAKMALPGSEKTLMDYGRIEIEYKRVACQYPGKNLVVKVGEHSRYPNYLALTFLYQSGTSDITAVEIFEEDTVEWKTCRKAYGAVWDISPPPKGPLTLRVFLDGGPSVTAQWALVPNVIPTYWTPGVTYDTSIQLN